MSVELVGCTYCGARRDFLYPKGKLTGCKNFRESVIHKKPAQDSERDFKV